MHENVKSKETGDYSLLHNYIISWDKIQNVTKETLKANCGSKKNWNFKNKFKNVWKKEKLTKNEAKCWKQYNSTDPSLLFMLGFMR